MCCGLVERTQDRHEPFGCYESEESPSRTIAREGAAMVTDASESACLFTGDNKCEMAGRPQPGTAGIEDGLCVVSMNFLQVDVDARASSPRQNHCQRRKHPKSHALAHVSVSRDREKHSS